VLDHQPGNPGAQVEAVQSIFQDTLSGASSRLGQRLALHGVRYVVVVEANAPAPFSSLERPVDAQLKSRLTEQLDLVRIEIRPGATIYENRAYVPTVSAFADGAMASTAPGQPPADFMLALPEVTSLRSYRGGVQPGEIYLAAPIDSNWTLRVDGEAQDRASVFEWSQAFFVEQPGIATLTHSNDQGMWFATMAQFVAWIVVTFLLILGRRRRT